MSLSFYKCLCCTFLICGFAFPVKAESMDDHVNAYWESARKLDEKTDAKFADAIIRLAKNRQAHLKPGIANRHPELAYLLLFVGASGAHWMMQDTLDSLEEISEDGRVKLCRALERERVELMAISAEHANMISYCESASQPTQQADARLLGENAELAIKIKVTIKPEIATRYPTLIHQQLTAQSNKFCGDTQNILDSLEELGSEKRAQLCKILEKERLALKLIDLN